MSLFLSWWDFDICTATSDWKRVAELIATSLRYLSWMLGLHHMGIFGCFMALWVVMGEERRLTRDNNRPKWSVSKRKLYEHKIFLSSFLFVNLDLWICLMVALTPHKSSHVVLKLQNIFHQSAHGVCGSDCRLVSPLSPSTVWRMETMKNFSVRMAGATVCTQNQAVHMEPWYHRNPCTSCPAVRSRIPTAICYFQ